MEMRMARLWFWEGHFARSGIDLKWHYHPEPLIVTDLDLLAFDVQPSLRVSRTIGEVKTGSGKSAPKPLDRIVWLRGLKELVDADNVELVSGIPPSARARKLASSIGVSAQSLADVERRESRAQVGSVQETGSHGARATQERFWVHKYCKSHQNLERAFWFLRSEVWFHDDVSACKRLIGLYRQLSELWTPDIDDADSRALRWLFAETVSVFGLFAVAVASEAVKYSPEMLAAEIGERLSAGHAPADAMRRIAADVDKYVAGLLAAANASANVRTEAMGALHPEAPPWTGQFVELLTRVASVSAHAQALPRQLDVLVYESVVWRREVNSEPYARLSLGDPEVGRLIRLIAAFLRSQAANVDVIDRALSTEIRAARVKQSSNDDVASVDDMTGLAQRSLLET